MPPIGPNANINQAVNNVAEMFGRFHIQNKNFNYFQASTTVAAPVTLTTSGSTSQTFGLWNPAGNNLDAVPVRLIVTIQGTGTQANLAWAFSKNIGSAVATGAPVSAATTLAIVNANLTAQGNTGTSAMLPTSAATLATAPTLLRHSPIGWGAPVTNTTILQAGLVDLFDGDVIVAPGTAIWLSATAAPGVTANCTLEWIETLH